MILCPHCGGVFVPATDPLTRRQSEVYRYLAGFSAEHGYAPSFEDIARHFQLNSLATVHEHLSNLERKGYIARRYNESRSITLLVDPKELGGPVNGGPNPTGTHLPRPFAA